MKFKFILQRESLDLLNRIFKVIAKFWNNQRIFIYCDINGIVMYPETITETSLTYCQLTFQSPAKTFLPKSDTGIEYIQFFQTYIINSEKPNSRILFAPMDFTELVKAVQLMASLRLESPAVFKLSQEIINNYIAVCLMFINRNIW